MLSILALAPALALSAGCEEVDLDELEDGDVYFIKLFSDAAEVVSEVNDLADVYDFEPIHVFDAASEGFTVRLPIDVSEEIEQLSVVEYVLKDEGEEYLPPEEVPEEIELGANEVPTGIEFAGGPLMEVQDWEFLVAVIDTGVDSSHSDLEVAGQYDIVCLSNSRDCSDGSDPQGHGTHVAGTIGAVADGEGVVGMAPGAPIFDIRVLDKNGSGYYSDILAGIEYILEHNSDASNTPIRVANMSLGGPAGSSLDDDMATALGRLEDSGVLVAIAAGNESQDTANVVPAGLDKGVVVSAYNASSGYGGFAWFSNYGDEVDIAAPGVSINSTVPGGSYASYDGTSMASPHVAGAAAVYFAMNPDASFQDAMDALINTGENDYDGQGNNHLEPLLDISGW
jgi:hypothetical protein